MATPGRLTELKCPVCSGVHWTIDSDHRGMIGEYQPYETRLYECPGCRQTLTGFEVLRQSPPEFILQPHDLYPMTRGDFKYWLGILKAEFPDHPNLTQRGRHFYPRTPRQAHARMPAVLEMTDEEGSRTHFPECEKAMEWLDLMEEPGAFLRFSHKNGGELVVTLTPEQKFQAVYRNADGVTRRTLAGLDRRSAAEVILRYIHAKGWRLWARSLREFYWSLLDSRTK